ncbi:Alpha/Beta hydrolase protein [Scleroderma yunnanense]
MPRVPVIGRLSFHEYTALLASVFILVFETLLRFIIILLPKSVIYWFYERSRILFHHFSTSARPKSRSAEEDISNSIREAKDFGELCALRGYSYEEHVVMTKDGYLLGLHRIPEIKGQTRSRPGTSTGKPVVYLHHGLLMNSEVWVCLTDEERCIPFVLVEQGFDVWLGNNRGNKYSKKSLHYSPNSRKFWDYSLDDFAWHDIPDTIEYILDITKAASLGYVGFSQGTAQAFAALSIHPQLNEKVNVFIALAPAMRPTGLSAPVVDALMKASPTSMFLFFGRKAILSSVTTWQSILYPPIFTHVIDTALSFLFDWKSDNIAYSQKLAAYAHLYSYASVKSVVHWFQIMREAAFQMYDDDIGSAWGLLQMHAFTHSNPTQVQRSRCANGNAISASPTFGFSNSPDSSQSPTDPVSPATSASPRSSTTVGRVYHPPSHTRARAYRPVRFPTRNITTPIVLLYGTSDSLVDIDIMLTELPQHSTIAIPLEEYEHLDVLWGRNIHEDVIPEVVNALQTWREQGRGAESLQETGILKVSERPRKASMTMDMR